MEQYIEEEEELEEEIEEQPKPLPVIRPKRQRNTEDEPLINKIDAVETKYGGKKAKKRATQTIFSTKEAVTGWYMK